MDETFESYDESYDEAWDESYDEGESYDESYDEAEALPLLGTLTGIPGIASVLSGITGLGRARRPLPSVRLPVASSGVSKATLSTPAGSATINLPSALVRQDEFRAVTQRLQEGINRNTGRLNTVADDLGKLRRDFTAVETDTRKRLDKVQKDTRRALVVSDKKQTAALARLRKDQSSQQMTNLMIVMLMQSQQQSQFADHTHSVDGKVVGEGGGDNTMMMMLPMMMMGDSGGLGGDNAMMMAMMVMIMAQNK
jgi:hypothetical protein